MDGTKLLKLQLRVTSSKLTELCILERCDRRRSGQDESRYGCRCRCRSSSKLERFCDDCQASTTSSSHTYVTPLNVTGQGGRARC